MSQITVEKPLPEQLAAMGVQDWPIWTKEVSTFDWYYDVSETAYILAGEVVVTPKGGTAVHFGAGDLVTFACGLDCVWEIKQPLRKHYHFA